jgi:hypothetical protein
MDHIIKMEDEEYPLSSPSHDHAFFNHCLTTFYDQDSDEDIIQARCSTQEVHPFPLRSCSTCRTTLISAILL